MFNEQLAEIVKEISDEVIFELSKLMLRSKKLACGQSSPSFVVPARKVRAFSCLSLPALMVGLPGSAGCQPFSTQFS